MKTIMNAFRTILLPGVALCAALLAAAPALAQSIGRVLVASGEVTVVRGSTTQPATAGLALQVGDRVRTGAAGTAQLWFTDTSIVALRNGSDFVVERYSFTNSLTDNLVFNLVKGGYRTVAGLIGIQDRKAYVVKTKMATLGRRGTQYGIVYCEQDCPLPQGGLAPDGLYGGVYDGRVGVANNTPEVQFGRDEYFYIASINSIPQPLLGPPAFFADRLAGLAKNAQKPASEPPASKGTATSEKEDTAAAAAPPPAPYSATENRSSTGAPLVASNLPTLALLTSRGVPSVQGGHEAFIDLAFLPVGALSFNGSGGSQTLRSYSLSPLDNGTVGSSGTTDVGSNALAGVNWGRWVNPSVNASPDPFRVPGTQVPPGGLHYLYGTFTSPDVIAAKSGTFTFSDIGGTTPTASNGASHVSSNFGPINVNFTARTGTISSVFMQFSNFTFNFSNLAFSLVNAPSGGVGFGDFQIGVGTCSGACGSGSGSNLANADFAGAFYGSQGNYLGLAFQAASAGNTNPGRVTAGAVRLFGNPQPFTPPPVALLFANSLVESNGSVASYGGAVTGPASNLTFNGTGPGQTLTAFNLPQFSFSGAAGSGGISGAGFDADSGVYYGRWISGSITTGSPLAPQLTPGTQTSGLGVHYLYGTPTPDSVIAAKTGSAQYVDYVGTFPTASNGESANSYSFGPININFTNRTGVITSAQFSFPTSSWNFSNLTFNINVAPGQGASFETNLVNVGSCVGSGCGPVQGSNTARADLAGRFIGNSGNFLGLSFGGNSGGNSPSGNPNLTIGVVRLFKCPTCP